MHITPQEFASMERLLADLLASDCDACEKAAILEIHARVERLYHAGEGLRRSEQRLRQLGNTSGES